MAERRKPRKRNAGPARESKRLSLLDLPPAGEPRAEAPTDPTLVVPPKPKSTLLPAAAEPLADTSLESLARAARRASTVPIELAPTHRAPDAHPREAPPATMPPPPPPVVALPVVAQHAPAAAVPAHASSIAPQAAQPIAPTIPTEPSPPPDFGVPSSMLPPPVQMPSEPPRPRRERSGSAWLRTLGVIVLSATVGAVVSSTMWSVKSELVAATRHETSSESARTPAVAPTASCAPAAAVPAEPGSVVRGPAVPARIADSTVNSAREAPRIAFDALPVAQGKRRGVTVETISLDSTSSEPVSRAPEPVSRRATDAPPPTQRTERSASTPRGARESRRAAKASTPQSLPLQPSRATLSQAVERAASAATACDSGPQDGKVTVTFAPSGAVQSVSLVKGFGDAAVNGCVLRAFGRARVPAFSGDPVPVRKSVAW